MSYILDDNLPDVKSCLFCGNDNLEIVRRGEGFHSELETGWIVRCNYLKGGCGANGGSRETAQEAIYVCNARNSKKALSNKGELL